MLRNAVESGLVEHVLKVAGNHCVNGWNVFRQVVGFQVAFTHKIFKIARLDLLVQG